MAPEGFAIEAEHLSFSNISASGLGRRAARDLRRRHYTDKTGRSTHLNPKPGCGDFCKATKSAPWAETPSDRFAS